MSSRDWVLLVLNVLCTAISVYGAYKSIRYYKKSRYVEIHANLFRALDLVGSMLRRLPDVLVEHQNRRRRGVNPAQTVRSIGKELIDTLNSVVECIPSDYLHEFCDLLKDGKDFDLSAFLNSLTDGSGFCEEDGMILINRYQYDLCLKRLRVMQEFLKKKENESVESLK